MGNTLQIESYHDVALGVGVSLLFYAIYKLQAALYIPPCSEIERRAQAPIKHTGDDTKITIWGCQKKGEWPASVKGVTDMSPFVARVECYLRLIGQGTDINYVKAVSTDVHENPRTKLPFANVYGIMVDDSGRIIAEIQRHFQINPNEGLSKEQLTQAHLIRCLLTNSLYWVRYYMNFCTEQGRKTALEGFALPPVIAPLISAVVIKAQLANLNGQGTGRMTRQDVIEMGKRDLRALDSMLSGNNYILGTKQATVYDSDVYSFVSHLFYDTTPSAMEWVQDIRKELPKLDEYIDRMRQLLFPELKTKTN